MGGGGGGGGGAFGRGCSTRAQYNHIHRFGDIFLQIDGMLNHKNIRYTFCDGNKLLYYSYVISK